MTLPDNLVLIWRFSDHNVFGSFNLICEISRVIKSNPELLLMNFNQTKWKKASMFTLKDIFKMLLLFQILLAVTWTTAETLWDLFESCQKFSDPNFVAG